MKQDILIRNVNNGYHLKYFIKPNQEVEIESNIAHNENVQIIKYIIRKREGLEIKQIDSYPLVKYKVKNITKKEILIQRNTSIGYINYTLENDLIMKVSEKWLESKSNSVIQLQEHFDVPIYALNECINQFLDKKKREWGVKLHKVKSKFENKVNTFQFQSKFIQEPTRVRYAIAGRVKPTSEVNYRDIKPKVFIGYTLKPMVQVKKSDYVCKKGDNPESLMANKLYKIKGIKVMQGKGKPKPTKCFLITENGKEYAYSVNSKYFFGYKKKTNK